MTLQIFNSHLVTAPCLVTLLLPKKKVKFSIIHDGSLIFFAFFVLFFLLFSLFNSHLVKNLNLADNSYCMVIFVVD